MLANSNGNIERY